MPREVGAFVRGEEPQRGLDECDNLLEVARPRGAEERLQFGEREFDRIEIRTVGRQKTQLRARLFDRVSHLGLFVDREVIQHHHVAGLERRHQDLFDVGEEGRIVDRSIEHGRCGEAIAAQCRDHGVGLPVTARGVIVEACATRTAPIAAQQIRRDAGLVEKHILARIAQRLAYPPAIPRVFHVSAILFVGVYRFF